MEATQEVAERAVGVRALPVDDSGERSRVDREDVDPPVREKDRRRAGSTRVACTDERDAERARRKPGNAGEQEDREEEEIRARTRDSPAASADERLPGDETLEEEGS